ncbi:MAG: type 4b pilus protein PilO2 [Gammaproteobacteria bacterium]|nr:type 4b pilus protein PilO2 [Gammaproteobacteria bacterium]
MSEIHSELHIAPIDGIKSGGFISGLFWQTIPEGASSSEEFVRVHEELDFNAGISRDGDIKQLGLFSRKRVKGEHLYSLAATVVSAVAERFNETTFLFTGKTPSGQWVYISCRDGLILPNGDFSGTEEEVSSKFTADLSVHNWSLALMPPEWGESDDASTIALDSLVDFTKLGLDKRNKIDLYIRDPADTRKAIALSFTAAVLILGSYLGYDYWSNTQFAAKLAAQLDAERQARIALQMNQVIPPPWESMSEPLGFVSECVKQISTLSINAGGWELEGAFCDRNSAIGTWNRGKNNTIAHLKAVMPDAKINLLGGQASYTIIPTHEAPKLGDTLEPRQAVSSSMLNSMQQIGESIALVLMPPPPPQARPDGTFPPPWDWVVYNWTVSTHLDPNIILNLLNRDGLRVKRVSLAVKEGLTVWTIEGIQYAS